MAQRSILSSRRRPRRRARRQTDAAWLLAVAAFAAVIAMLVGWQWFGGRPGQRGEPMTMAQARASNAAIPIEARRRVVARPFLFHGSVAARTEAIDCLATAALYEAGNDQRGQRAVIQVVLNRVRAPGFPPTICGVVYQGYARTTGCQFSFTCDGSFDRRPVHLGWATARHEARRALAGHVFAGVGRATHYHAVWMVPYWRGSLTKIAQIGSHLFYVRG